MGEMELFTALNLVFANADSFVRVLVITHGAGGHRDFVGAGVLMVSLTGRVLVSTVQFWMTRRPGPIPQGDPRKLRTEDR